MAITLNQKRNSSFLSSLILFIAISSLLFTFLYFGKKHYQQSKDESENYKLPKETFEPLPDKELPPPKEKKEREKLWELTHPQILDRLAIQEEWKSKVLPLLSNKRTTEEIDDFLKKSYNKFLEKELNPYERKWWTKTKTKLIIRPKKVKGRTTTKETLTSDIEKCKKIFPETKKAGIEFKGFGGWLTEEEKGEKEKDNTTLMGLCTNDGGKKAKWEKLWGKVTICYWNQLYLSIKLKPELFFFRHNSWVDKTRINPKTGKPLQIKIGREELIETIAHELAHAVINTILIDGKVAKLDEGGHGDLHDDLTDRIEQFIKRSDEYTNLRDYINSLD